MKATSHLLLWVEQYVEHSVSNMLIETVRWQQPSDKKGMHIRYRGRSQETITRWESKEVSQNVCGPQQRTVSTSSTTTHFRSR